MPETQDSVTFVWESDGLNWYVIGEPKLTTEEAQTIALARLEMGLKNMASALSEIADALRERDD